MEAEFITLSENANTVVGLRIMDRRQLGKTTASVSSYWALLHHYKRPFFFFFSIFEKI
jgi:hypothetical protein